MAATTTMQPGWLRYNDLAALTELPDGRPRPGPSSSRGTADRARPLEAGGEHGLDLGRITGDSSLVAPPGLVRKLAM